MKLEHAAVALTCAAILAVLPTRDTPPATAQMTGCEGRPHRVANDASRDASFKIAPPLAELPYDCADCPTCSRSPLPSQSFVSPLPTAQERPPRVPDLASAQSDRSVQVTRSGRRRTIVVRRWRPVRARRDVGLPGRWYPLKRFTARRRGQVDVGLPGRWFPLKRLVARRRARRGR